MIQPRVIGDAPSTLVTYTRLETRIVSRGDAETRGIDMQDLDAITGAVINASIRIHRDLGPGLLESVYEAILARVLHKEGFDVVRQKALAFEYEELVFQDAYRVDLLINGSVIVEIKSVEHLGKQHAKQLLTYLKLSNIQVGLLINFGAPVLRDGVRRVVNGFVPPASPRLRVNKGLSENQQ